MFRTAAGDSPTLLCPRCLTRSPVGENCRSEKYFFSSPSLICTFRRAGWGAAVWVAHVLLALSRALSPQRLLLAFVGTVSVDVALGVPEVFPAGFVRLPAFDGILARLRTRLVEAVFIHSLILSTLLQCDLVPVGFCTLRRTCWFVVTAVGIALVLETDPRAFILPASTCLAARLAGSVVAGGHVAVLLTGRIFHLVLKGLCALGRAGQIAFLSVTVLLTFWLSLSSHISRLTDSGTWAVAIVEVGVLRAGVVSLPIPVSLLTTSGTLEEASFVVKVHAIKGSVLVRHLPLSCVVLAKIWTCSTAIVLPFAAISAVQGIAFV